VVVRRRRRALRRWGDGESIESICREASCSRATLFRWRARFDADGMEGLRDRYRAGGRIELPAVIEQLILTVRLLTYWNSRRLAAEFRRREIWPLSHAQVDRLLGRSGTNRPSVARVPGPRYERAYPNELWHIDLKGPFYLRGTRGTLRSCHFIALVDDHSRFLLGIKAVPTKEAVTVLQTLAEAIELCGVPLALMSDNGTPFVTIVRSMLSRFQRTLTELEIRHIRTQVDTPWTNGKVEAFWATLQAEVLDRQQLADLAAAETAVAAFAGYYNYHRLHGALGWHTPAERFDGTPFTDRGFEHVPALVGVADLLADLAAAA
jgi:transposase InsO family protein